jgi:xylan 1,4-beta-xylosidase
MTTLLPTHQPWQHLAPEYAEWYSNANLEAQGKLFHIAEPLRHSNDGRRLHWHESYELGYIVRGQGQYVMGQQFHPFQAGQVFVVNSLEPHMAYAEGGEAELFVVVFHTMLLDEGWIARSRREARLPFVAEMSLPHPVLPLGSPLNNALLELLEDIRLEWKAQSPMWEVVVGGLIIQAVGLLAREVSGSETDALAARRRRALRRITGSLKLIEERFNQNLTLRAVAEASTLSEPHCCALFQEAVAMSPIAYRNARRLTEAQRLLRLGEFTVQEIAYKVGFSSPQEFNRLFRRSFGITPTQFARTVW